MKVAISGGSGQLARRVADLVLEKLSPQDLIVTTRTPAALAPLAERGVTVRRADFAEPASLRDAFAGAERLLLVSTTDLKTRTAQHLAAVDAAKAAGVRHIVYTSCLRPEPPNPAAVAPSHHATEQALKASGLAWTALRNSLYAEYQLMEGQQALASGVLLHNRGTGAVAYVSREDCAAVAAAVLLQGGHEGAVYDVTGGKPFTPDDLAALYSRLGGKPVQARAVSDDEFIAALTSAAPGDSHARYGAELFASFGRSIREGYMSSCTDVVAKLTGRAPIALEQVLAPLGKS
jgi:NAD(P)H dehydrogenase (quinone)